MLPRQSSSISTASSRDICGQDHFTVNRIIDPASVLNRNSGGALQIEGAGAHANDELPLSSAQLGIWFAQRLDPTSPAYNIGEYIEIHGSVDPLRFEQALRHVVREAEALRLRIVERAGNPRQVIGPPPAWSMPFFDLSAETDARAVAETWMKADLARPVDPTRGPLFAFALFKASADRFFWYARYHHLIMDGFAMWLVARRVANLYTQLSKGRAVRGAPFGSLAVLLEQDAAYRSSEQFAQDRQFWLDCLADRPDPVSLGGNPTGPSHSFLRSTEYLQHSTVDQLRSLARRSGTSLSRVISSATAIFLHRLSGARHVVFGLPVSARDSIARCIPGMVSNVLPLRLSLHPSMTVSEVIGQAARQIGQGLKHQQYQLADLRRDVGRSANGRTLFGTSLNIMRFRYDFTFAGHYAVSHNLSLGPVENLSIAVYARSDDGPLRIDFDANPTVHRAADLADRQQNYLRLLTAIVDVDRAIGSLDILDPQERATILGGWNDTAHAVPRATLPELFAAQAAQSPGALALVFGEERLSYGELDRRANQLAHHLRRLGVGPEAVV